MTTLFLFPGQGSQKPGMGLSFLAASSTATTALNEAAALYSGTPGLISLLTETEEAELNRTIHAQPALLALSYGIACHLREAGIRPDGCAGHSLGEISALVVAGSLTFPDALRLVQERARLMSEDIPAGGMAAVMGMAADAIAAVLPESVQVANYNGPSQTIISGTLAGLDEAAAALKSAGAKRVLPLRVSGPFHSHLMRPAAEKLAKFLESIPISAPAVRFISSVSAQPEVDPAVIRRLLAEQLYRPVRWTEVMAQCAPDDRLIEVGPGTVLKGLAKRMEGLSEVYAAESPECCAQIPQE